MLFKLSDDELADEMEKAVLAASPKAHVGIDWEKQFDEARSAYKQLAETAKKLGIAISTETAKVFVAQVSLETNEWPGQTTRLS